MFQEKESHTKTMEPMTFFPIARSTPLYERHKDENSLSNKVNILQQVAMRLVYLHSQTPPPSYPLSTINVPLHVLGNAVKMIDINGPEALSIARCQMPTSLHSDLVSVSSSQVQFWKSASDDGSEPSKGKWLCLDAGLQHLMEEELARLMAHYHRLKRSIAAVEQYLPKKVCHLFRRECKVQAMEKGVQLKFSDTRELREQIQALSDPQLLGQLSSYEEDNLKPFIVNFLVQCRENGVQPELPPAEVYLSPSTPAAQVLGFILSRKDYYITDLHINREHFSPWDVDTPPFAEAPPTMDWPNHRSLDALLTSYSALFCETSMNVITLPRGRYHDLKGFFQYQPHTGVHLPSQGDVRDQLHCTPLFAPLSTALLRKVVWFLFIRDADELSHTLGDYEKKLATFVSQFLLACHREGVVPDSEDGCDLSDPAYFLSHILELKPYYVGSLCIDESLFAPFSVMQFLVGEGRNAVDESMYTSLQEPTLPSSNDSSVSSQSRRKGKHRQTACSTAVPSKCSAQRDEKMDYEAVAENSANSTASNHSAVKEALEHGRQLLQIRSELNARDDAVKEMRRTVEELRVANARLEATLVNYESDRNQLEAAQLQRLQAVAERDEYMGRTLALQQKLLDKEELIVEQQKKVDMLVREVEATKIRYRDLRNDKVSLVDQQSVHLDDLHSRFSVLQSELESLKEEHDVVKIHRQLFNSNLRQLASEHLHIRDKLAAVVQDSLDAIQKKLVHSMKEFTTLEKAQETVAEHVKAAESQYQAAANEIKKLERETESYRRKLLDLPNPTKEELWHHVVPAVAARWREVATYLGLESHVITAVHVDQSSDEDSCLNALLRWMDGTGKQPKTWFTVLEAMRRAGFTEPAKELEVKIRSNSL